MKILVFGASSSRRSINKALASHAAARLRDEFVDGAEIERIDLLDYEMPIYSIDREREGGIPEPAHRFLGQIAASDGLIISYAEHNGLYTVAYKNLFDWASRVERKVFQGKPMLALAASPGGGGGANVLATALKSAPHFGAEVVSSLSVPRFGDRFDVEAGVLTDVELSQSLGRSLEAFAERLAAGKPE